MSPSLASGVVVVADVLTTRSDEDGRACAGHLAAADYPFDMKAAARANVHLETVAVLYEGQLKIDEVAYSRLAAANGGPVACGDPAAKLRSAELAPLLVVAFPGPGDATSWRRDAVALKKLKAVSSFTLRSNKSPDDTRLWCVHCGAESLPLHHHAAEPCAERRRAPCREHSGGPRHPLQHLRHLPSVRRRRTRHSGRAAVRLVAGPVCG